MSVDAPNVLFVQNRVCGRTWRSAKVLHDDGHPVVVLETGDPAPHHDYSVFKEHIHLDLGRDVRSMVLHRRAIIDGIRSAVRAHDIDVIHSMNAPDNLGLWSMRNVDVPVVHDIHDLQSEIPVRFGNLLTRPLIRFLYDRWERDACKEADAVVVVSDVFARYIEGRYHPKRVAIIPNKAIAGPAARKPRLSATDGKIHVVYAGSFSLTPGTHRTFLPAMRSMARDDVHIHVYPVMFDPAERDALKAACAVEPNLHYHDAVPAVDLIEELTQYDHGWLFFPTMTENVRMASATKLYEYILAGLPVVANTEGRIGEYVARTGCGIVVEDIRDAWGPLHEDRSFTLPVEDCLLQASHLMDLYRDVLAGRRQGPPATRAH